jgi:hypothetical protein
MVLWPRRIWENGVHGHWMFLPGEPEASASVWNWYAAIQHHRDQSELAPQRHRGG